LDRIGDKIKRNRERKGLTQAQLGSALGVSAQTVSGWESGDEPPPSKHLGALSQIIGMRIEELLGIDLPVEAYPVTEMVRLPVIGQAQAGGPRLAVRDYDEEKPVERELIRGGDYIWVRVEGDSMTGAGIHPDGYALVRIQPHVEDGQIAVVDLYDDGVVIKYFHRTKDRIVLISANPSYIPLSVTPDRCRVIGLVEEYRKRTI